MLPNAIGHRTFWLLYSLIMLAALYTSLNTTLLIFHNEPDTSHSLLLWQGINTHGWVWLRDWLFTPDNWLLSLVPLHFLGFMVAGATPLVPIVLGWIIMVAAAFIGGLIAWQSGAKRAAPYIPILLLFLGVYAHAHGFVSYSMSHNITNLFGLAAVSLTLAWVRKPSYGLLMGIAIALTAGAVSDPWMLAAYNLPLMLSAIIFLHPRAAIIKQVDSLKLLGVALFSIIATKSQLFEILGFVPGLHFQLGDWETINQNATYLIRNWGGLFNLIPFQTGNAFIPALGSWLIVIGLWGFHGIKAAQTGYLLSDKRQTLALMTISLFSIGGIAAAFVITAVEASDHSARFLINIVYLLPVLLGNLFEYNWVRLSKASKGVTILIIGLLLTASIISHVLIEFKQENMANHQDPYRLNTSRLIHYLEQQGLNYGYGAYWGSTANAVTVESNNRVIIRPVTFSKANGKVIFGNRFQSSRRWYTTEDAPKGQQTFFIIVHADGEECEDTSVCIRGLTQQFGTPSWTLFHENATILVWNHPLIGFRPELSPIPVTIGQTIRFNAKQDHAHGMHGWSIPEDWGVWSEEETASLLLQLDTLPKQDMLLQVESHAFLAKGHPAQTVEVTINGQALSPLQYNQENNAGVRTLTIPQQLFKNGNRQLLIHFQIKIPKSPAELGVLTDGRKLGLGLTTLTLTLTLTRDQGSP